MGYRCRLGYVGSGGITSVRAADTDFLLGGRAKTGRASDLARL